MKLTRVSAVGWWSWWLSHWRSSYTDITIINLPTLHRHSVHGSLWQHLNEL